MYRLAKSHMFLHIQGHTICPPKGSPSRPKHLRNALATNDAHNPHEVYIAFLLYLLQSDRSFFLPKSLACMFLVIEGSLTRNPSNSLSIMTWQPNLDVSVRPNARSSMSFSSSSGSGMISYNFSSSTIT